jgi:hypothetical protein
MNNAYQSKEKKQSFLKSEVFVFYLLFTAAVYFVYKKPGLCLYFFIALLVAAWFSRRNYFWMAFFFIILESPGYFFEYAETSHLPFIKILPGVSLTPIDCFILLMLAKLIMQGKRIKLKLKTPLALLFLNFIFAFFLGAIFFQSSSGTSITFIRPTIYMAWILVFTGFIESKEDMHNFFKLLLPMAFFIVFTQIYFLSKSREFINVFDPQARAALELNSLTGEIRAPMGGVLALFLIYIYALVAFNFKEQIISKWYLTVIISLCMLSAILSATRSWFGIFLFILISIYYKQIAKMWKMGLLIMLTIFILFSLVRLGVFSKEYLKESLWGRLSQVFIFASGKGGQIDSYESRQIQSGKIFDVIKEQLFFGYGFSDISVRYHNNNLGFLNTILISGIFGQAIIIFLAYSYFKMIFSALKKIPPNSSYRPALRVLPISFSGILIFYFIDWDFFSFLYFEKVAFMMVFFGMSEVFIRNNENGI